MKLGKKDLEKMQKKCGHEFRLLDSFRNDDGSVEYAFACRYCLQTGFLNLHNMEEKKQ